MLQFDKYVQQSPAIEAVMVWHNNLFDVSRLIGADRFEVFNLDQAIPAVVFRKDHTGEIATVAIGRYLIRSQDGSFTTMSSDELHTSWEGVE